MSAADAPDMRPVYPVNFLLGDEAFHTTSDDPDVPELVVTTTLSRYHYWGDVEIKETKGGWLKVSYENELGELRTLKHDMDDVLSITYPAKIKKHEESL